MELARYLQGNEIYFLLVLIRVSAFMVALPAIGGPSVPNLVKVLLALAVSLALFPMIQVPSGFVDPAWWVLGISQEVLIGSLMGLVTRLIFAAVEIGAEVMGIQMGLGIANVFDPISNEQASLIGRLHGVLAILIFFIMEGHHFVLQAMVRSFEVVPFLGMSLSASLMDHLIRLGGGMFVLAMKIAIPVSMALILANMTIGILARVVPQMNVLLFGFPITIGFGFLIVGASIPIFVGLIQGEMSGLGGLFRSLLLEMRAPR